MDCFFCKGEMTNENAAFMVELPHGIIVIKNVPTNICDRCGQKSYNDEVAKRIEQIANRLRSTITEVAVVHYSENNAA